MKGKAVPNSKALAAEAYSDKSDNYLFHLACALLPLKIIMILNTLF